MSVRILLAVLTLCLAAALVLAAFPEPAKAQGAAAPQTGLSSLKAKAYDEKRAPTAVQKWLGLGSIAVMIAVVRYL